MSLSLAPLVKSTRRKGETCEGKCQPCGPWVLLRALGWKMRVMTVTILTCAADWAGHVASSNPDGNPVRSQPVCGCQAHFSGEDTEVWGVRWFGRVHMVVTRSAGDVLCDAATRSPAAVSGCWGSGSGDRVFILPSGICQCGHHTEGPSCERCSPGFHGNPFVGQADDCQPCPCPGRSACTALPGSREVVCTHCPLGQRGEWPEPWGLAAAWAPGLESWLWIQQMREGPASG